MEHSSLLQQKYMYYHVFILGSPSESNNSNRIEWKWWKGSGRLLLLHRPKKQAWHGHSENVHEWKFIVQDNLTIQLCPLFSPGKPNATKKGSECNSLAVWLATHKQFFLCMCVHIFICVCGAYHMVMCTHWFFFWLLQGSMSSFIFFLWETGKCTNKPKVGLLLMTSPI